MYRVKYASLITLAMVWLVAMVNHVDSEFSEVVLVVLYPG